MSRPKASGRKRSNLKTVKNTETKPTEAKARTQAPARSAEEYAKKWLKDPSPTPDPDPDAQPPSEPDAAVSTTECLQISHKEPPSQWGALGPLPQEVLDMIYEPLFAAGDIAMTRVSRTYYENTQTALFRSVFFPTRILQNKRWNKSTSWFVDPDVPSDTLLDVRSLRINVTPAGHSLSEYTETRGSDAIGQLVRSAPKLRNLHLDFERVLLAPDFKIGEAEFLRSLDSLTLTWNDFKSGLRSCELYLRHVDGIEIETVRDFQELCDSEDPRVTDLMALESEGEELDKARERARRIRARAGKDFQRGVACPMWSEVPRNITGCRFGPWHYSGTHARPQNVTPPSLKGEFWSLILLIIAFAILACQDRS